ncbi:MAG: hypothetical protein JW715_11985 [Sedimentisphaerales bacterium]|nr:hypothetical protein [Sedimentisphaerales bacterium]
MRPENKTVCSLILLACVIILQGCTGVRDTQQAETAPSLADLMQNDSVARRFQESTEGNSNPVESAIELSEKYARLSEEASVLRQQNKELVAYNQQLSDKVKSFETQLQQTQKELTEANQVLIEMRVELNNWKSDVLGFREEMRDAETAQLEALLKILHVLGGEIKTESAQSDTIGTAKTTIGRAG